MKPKRIVLYTRPGCEDSNAAKEFLKRRDLHFEEIIIDENPETLCFIKSVNEGKVRTLTLEVDRHVFHCSPFDPQMLARQLGLPQEETAHKSHG